MFHDPSPSDVRALFMYSQMLRDRVPEQENPDPNLTDPNLTLHNSDQSVESEESSDDGEGNETVVVPADGIHYMLIDRNYECVGEEFTLPTDDYIVSDEDLKQRLLTVIRDEQESIFGQ